MSTQIFRKTPLALAAACGLYAGQALLHATAPDAFAPPIGTALAADHGGGHSSGGHSGGSSGRGGHSAGGHSSGHDGGHDSGGHDSDHGGKGKKGKGPGGSRGGHAESSAHGHVGGGGSKAVESRVFRDQGGPPVWAREGIPEVELGRLNVARAPRHVLDKALGEAQASLAAGESPHSPLQSLALYRELILTNPAEAAKYLGQASDKRMPISADSVTALNAILGLAPDLGGYSYGGSSGVGAFAAHADAVRQSIADSHDHGEEP
jgi:hypothetical protein